MQEFVGPVRIGMRPQHAGHKKLRLRKPLTQHPQEGYRSAAAQAHRVASEHLFRSALHRGFEPGRKGGRVPTSGGRLRLEADLRTIGWIALQSLLKRVAGARW